MNNKGNRTNAPVHFRGFSKRLLKHTLQLYVFLRCLTDLSKKVSLDLISLLELGQENQTSELYLTHNEQRNEFCSVYTLAEMDETISQLSPR